MSEQNQRNKDAITWRIAAYVLSFVLWAMTFALVCWLCKSVEDLKVDMAVVKNKLNIPTISFLPMGGLHE